MKKRRWIIKVFSFFAMFSFLISCMCSVSAVPEEQKVTLKKVLDNFGFISDAQQDAFKIICKSAGVSLPEEFGVHELLEFASLVQEIWVNRKDKQERWETKDLNWMKQDPWILNKYFSDLGIVKKALPSETRCDAACILGARKSEMAKRIKFVEYLVEAGYSFNYIVLLTGARPATVGVDGTAEEIEEIAQFFGIDVQEVTEAHIFKYLYEKSSLNGKFKLVVIDTPTRDGRRPTTQTTVEDFCAWLVEHPGEIDTALFVSSQPYVAYQMAIIAEILHQNNSELKFQVVGEGYAPDEKSVKTLAGALGSFIWARMPDCLRSFRFEIKSDEDLALAKGLYAHMPWLYNSLPFSQDLTS